MVLLLAMEGLHVPGTEVSFFVWISFCSTKIKEQRANNILYIQPVTMSQLAMWKMLQLPTR